MTSRNELFRDVVSDMAVKLRILSITTRGTAENKDTITPTAGS